MMTLNGNKVVFGSFPNSEVHLAIEKLNIRPKSYVNWTYEDDGDFFKLALLKSYLDSMNAETCLHIHYMPYSRMDRPNGVYVVSCPVAAKIINNMKFTHVSVREPHSKACMDSLEYSSSYIWTSAWIGTLMEKDGWDAIFFPDLGAKLRYDEKHLPAHGYGTKTRDFASGNIERYEIKGEVGKRVLIVDDLCSRGGTFVKAAELLRLKGAKSVGLLVAVCENNVHTGNMFDYIDRLYTSKDCVGLNYHPRITLL